MPPPAQEQSIRRAAGLAWLGLVVTISGPVVHYGLLMDIPILASSGAVAFGLMSAGSVLGLIALWYDRRFWVRGLGLLPVLLLALFAYGFLWLSKIPPSATFEALQTAPPFTLPNQDGKPVAFADAYTAGPVLLVFYRGHW